MKGNFYFVATPIGNLDDVSTRQINTLKECDVIFCEDTRHSLILLNRFDINKPLKSYHKFNYNKAIKEVIDLLLNGKNVCLITDAGMPGISDPGSEIVEELNQNQIDYTVISGTSALLNSFVISGFSAPFTFVGFLPNKNKEKKLLLEEVRDYKSTLIFYASPHDINEDIKCLYNYLGERNICVCNELTKKFEKKYFSTLSNFELDNPKGEYVIVVEGNKQIVNDFENISIIEHYNYYSKLGYTKNDAIKQVAKDKKLPKQSVYNEIVNCKK